MVEPLTYQTPVLYIYDRKVLLDNMKKYMLSTCVLIFKNSVCCLSLLLSL